MNRRIPVIFEKGVFRPLEKTDGLEEETKGEVIVSNTPLRQHTLAKHFGVLSRDEGDELKKIVEAEFEKVDESAW